MQESKSVVQNEGTYTDQCATNTPLLLIDIENYKFSFRSVSLLLEALEERDPEIVYNAAVTLANIAMYDGNHSLLIHSDAVESLKKFVPNDSRYDY